MRWYFRVLKKYAVFKGRARRTEYWMFFLCDWIIIFVLFLIDSWFAMKSQGIIAYDGRVFIRFLLTQTDVNQSNLILTYYIATLLPTLAVIVRRLHDTGKSGFWLLIMLILMVVFEIADVGLFVLIISICLFVLLGKEGDPMENAYGPNPKEEEQSV